ncbi:MAG: VOC family protein [Thermoleophilia bacterium]|nr:VOC family protein [Thermoleophilia bacterium]
MVNAVQHAGLTVTDLDRSLAFYRDLLGLEVFARGERRGGYFAAIVGYPDTHVRFALARPPGSAFHLELFQYLSPGPRTVELEPRLVGVTHVCLLVDDLASLHARLREHGVDTFLGEPVVIDHGRNEGGCGLYLRDPDGIVVELFQPPRP